MRKIVLAVLFWIGWGYILFFIPPDSRVSLITFHVLLFLALFLTLALLLANSRRGLLLSLYLILLLVFRYFKIANYLNLIILAGIIITLEVYFIKSSK